MRGWEGGREGRERGEGGGENGRRGGRGGRGGEGRREGGEGGREGGEEKKKREKAVRGDMMLKCNLYLSVLLTKVHKCTCSSPHDMIICTEAQGGLQAICGALPS